MLEVGFEIRDPLRGKAEDYPKGKKFVYRNYPKIPEMSGRAFVMRDHWDVATCDAILCNLAGAEKVSIGSIFELAWAMNMHKLVIIVMEKSGSIHDHEFVKESGLVFSNLDHAIDYLRYCAGETMKMEEEE